LSEQQLDVVASFRVVRDHKWTCLVFVLLGLTASIGYLALRPPLYSAESLVLFPGSTTASGSQTIPASDMSTAGQVATSSTVLSPAGRQLRPSLSLATLKQRVSAEGVATTVLKITAGGTTAAQAETLANAVANQLVTFETAVGSVKDQSALVGLRNNAAQLTKQINELNGEITAANNRLARESRSSTAGLQDSALVATLNAEQNQATLQLNNVNTQIAQAELGTSLQGIDVIQFATTANKPSILHKFYIGIIGALCGLFVGTGLILAWRRGNRRLHRRDEIADALGVPVLISMTAESPRQRISSWVKLLKQYSPSAADRWNVRQAIGQLELDGVPAHLTVLAIAGDSASMAAAPQIAIILSTFGVPTDLVLTTSHQFAAPLYSACNRLSKTGNDTRPNLRVWSGDSPGETNTPSFIVTCIVVDGAKPTMPRMNALGITVLAVSPGFRTAEDLARVAIAAAAADMTIRGVVLTNPDVDDRTTGRFPEPMPRRALGPHPSTLAISRLIP
jgi:capsular polysaccharide biosynthesis protein